jgi:hypothetical protein
MGLLIREFRALFFFFRVVSMVIDAAGMGTLSQEFGKPLHPQPLFP